MTSIYSWNVNGIRAVTKNGFSKWFQATQPDILCLQETRAQVEQLDDELRSPAGYHTHWLSAEKKGYSGVSILSKRKPDEMIEGIGDIQFDSEGRTLTFIFNSTAVISAYFPNSQHDHARLPYKLAYCSAILKYCDSLRKKGLGIVLTGDYNIANKEIDLANPKANVDNPGFLPEERDWMDSFLASGYTDTFRLFTKDGGHYTWWSYRFQARAKNIGWRIDYLCTNQEIEKLVQKSFICADVMGSDHCPVGIILNQNLIHA